MKYTIPGPNVKLFGRAVQTLTKIGDELYVIADDKTLSLKAFGASRSSYLCFRFERRFFSGTEAADEAASGYRGKLSARSSLLAFRSVQALERSVEECVFQLCGDQALVVLRFRRGLSKRFWLPLVEYEELHFSFEPDAYASSVCGQAKLLSDVLANFPPSVPEVTLRLSPRGLDVCTHLEAADSQRAVRTSVSVQAAELDDVRCDDGGTVELTLCLRALRAVLGFCEGLTTRLQLDAPGRPLVGSLDGVPGLEATFVSATLGAAALAGAPPCTPERPGSGDAEARRRHRAFLLGLTEPPLDGFTSQMPRDDQVLAEASDDDDD